MLYNRFLKYVLISFIGLYVQMGFSQDKPNRVEGVYVSGRVVEVNEAPIPFVSVEMYNQMDSTLVLTTVTNDQGKFQIPANRGLYYLKLSSLSFQNRFISDVLVQLKTVNMGDIELVKNRRYWMSLLWKRRKIR